ncbi:hypothetical protein [Rufibacter latericius]|uniref:hypothetical protein n=1 Tax=Rufibacter latericius TaxID=2487040 RepID=UPI00140317B9|nr:hypothetical protein [Rufibacter latericius]
MTKLKASDFKYPSKEEKIEANKNYPKIQRFGFPNEAISGNLLIHLEEYNNF